MDWFDRKIVEYVVMWILDGRLHDEEGPAYFMVGMLNSAPSLMPDGHRWVTVLTFV
jgi:hypothetical protein